MRLKLKHIIRWEQLRQKPFSKIEFTDSEDITALMYTFSEMTSSYNYFKKTTKGKAFKKLFRELDTYLFYLSQFQKQSQSEDANKVEVYIKDLVCFLIIKGVDAKFVYNELELCDLPLFFGELEKQEKTRLEESRFWSYLSILPHIDSSNMKSPTDFLPFPWEQEELKKIHEQDILDNIKGFEEFVSHYKTNQNEQ